MKLWFFGFLGVWRYGGRWMDLFWKWWGLGEDEFLGAFCFFCFFLLYFCVLFPTWKERTWFRWDPWTFNWLTLEPSTTEAATALVLTCQGNFVGPKLQVKTHMFDYDEWKVPKIRSSTLAPQIFFGPFFSWKSWSWKSWSIWHEGRSLFREDEGRM